jgi:predicted anti-sigma-YlaC factor YlaD
MSDNHIIQMLDERPFDSFGNDDVERVESHIRGCEECRAAFDAARIASTLIIARAQQTAEVPPFFNTRVLATIRERQLTADGPALLKLWRAAGALISAMALVLVVLTGMTIFTRSTVGPVPLVSASQNLYSAEYVVLRSGDDDDEMANDQVLNTVYDLEDDDGQ